MVSKETWQTISYGISIESTVKFTKSGFSVKVPLLFKLHIIWSGIFVNLKEQFDNMTYSGKPKVHDCLIFRFLSLACCIRALWFLFCRKDSKNNCHVRNWLSLIGMKQFYMSFTNTQKSVKLTTVKLLFVFKCIKGGKWKIWTCIYYSLDPGLPQSIQ